MAQDSRISVGVSGHKEGVGLVIESRGKRVMVVDDSATMRMFLIFHLIKMLPGVKISEAVDGVDALEQLRRQDVDMVLTDMNMPRMGGAGLVSAIRNDLKLDIPVIIITTKGETADRQRGLEVGADGYITKPLDIFEFRNILWRHLGRGR